MFYERSEKSSHLRNITKTKTFQFYFKSDQVDWNVNPGTTFQSTNQI